MNFGFNALLLLANSAIANGAVKSPRIGDLQTAFDLFEANLNVDALIETFKMGKPDLTPVCEDVVNNYVYCVSIPDEIDDSAFLVHPLVPAGTTLGQLAGTPDYDLAEGFFSAFRSLVNDDSCDENEGLVTYKWLSATDFTTPVMVTSLVKEFMSPVGFPENVDITVWNTFSDTHSTGGAEVVYDTRTSPPVGGDEFPLFPMNFPPMEGGFYDIDVGPDTITYRLRDNRSASNILFPDGTFDRYYFIMAAEVAEVSIVSSSNIVATAEIVAPDTVVSTIDAFGTGLVFPSTLGNNVIKVQIIGGTDLTEIGQEMILSYSLALDEERFGCASGPLMEEMLM